MFQKPFSFEGRIRRTEYGISVIFYLVITLIINAIRTPLANAIGDAGKGNAIIFLAFIPMLWFLFAQGAKRCHDRGGSGWFQIIPFYILFMLFTDGDERVNKYGDNPKGMSKKLKKSNLVSQSKVTLDSNKQKENAKKRQNLKVHDQLSNNDVIVRKQNAFDIGKIVDYRQIGKIQPYLDDVNPEVRRSAISSLEQQWPTGDSIGISLLTEKLMDSDVVVRTTAALALGEFIPRSTVPYVINEAIKGLFELLANEQDENVLKNIFLSLANIDDSKIIPSFKDAVSKLNLTAIQIGIQNISNLRSTDTRSKMISILQPIEAKLRSTNKQNTGKLTRKKGNETDIFKIVSDNDITALISYIKNGGNVEIKDKWNLTALAWSCHYGYTDIVKALIEAKANVNSKDVNDQTALMKASDKGHVNVVKILVKEKANVNVNAMDIRGQTALIMASQNGHSDVVKSLIEAKADVNIKDNEGLTAYAWASLSNHANVVNILKAVESSTTINTNPTFNEDEIQELIATARNTSKNMDERVKAFNIIFNKRKNSKTANDYIQRVKNSPSHDFFMLVQMREKGF